MTAFQASKTYLVEERANPTTDLYLLPKLLGHGITPVKLSFKELPPEHSFRGATVIFVRYVPKLWRKAIERHLHEIEKVVFFMDDDLFDFNASHGTPLKYRLKLLRLSSSRQGWLQRIGAQLWVSTPYLMQKYASWNPQLVYPRAVQKRKSAIRVFYHGSASHKREIHWLFEVVEAVLTADESIAFEIIGDSSVNKQFKHLPRTHILHPMSWQSYKTLISFPGRHIGLAPLLDAPFNHARSYTKFYDIAQAGAVGIYARESAFADVIEHEQQGLLLGMEKNLWIDAILSLASDPALRERMYAASLERIAHLLEHEE